MMFINLDEVESQIRHLIPPLHEAQKIVDAETDPAKRAKVINDQRKLWVAFRQTFDEYSHGKCWYTESKNLGTDDDIDHFRPKNQLREPPDHGGYYWLAFNWKNFRLSCHRGNRPRKNQEENYTGGKADHFPLVTPENRALGPDDDLRKEHPVLLDPTSIFDVSLLTFAQNGEARLAAKYADDPIAQDRVAQSIVLLHLNWPPFKEARLALYYDIQRLLARAHEEAPTLPTGSAPSPRFVDAVRDLRKLMTRDAEYSAAARAYVQLHSSMWWVTEILLKVA